MQSMYVPRFYAAPCMFSIDHMALVESQNSGKLLRHCT